MHGRPHLVVFHETFLDGFLCGGVPDGTVAMHGVHH